MIKISAVIITFNEEKNIERCLKSVADIADEIVILDSYSTDNTKAICANYNVKFFEQKFENYVNQKNKVLEFVTHSYVLSLDADEVLSDELQKSIVEVKRNWQFDGYSFNRLTFFCGKAIKHCGWYPDAKIRLWNKNKGKWCGNKVHETVKMENSSEQGFLKGDLLHYSFTSIEQHINQINKFSGLKAQVLFEKQKKANIFKIIFSPFIKFLSSYILKLGFLDGFYGFVICINSAHSKFLTYAKLNQLTQNAKKMTDEINKAVVVLKSGGIILYPTDTIWGLGCDATNAEAVKKIYNIKQREDSKSLLVLLDSESRLLSYVKDVPEMAWQLIEVSVEPITIIYPNAKNLAQNLIASDGSIGIRITTDEFCKSLIYKFRKPIVSTSANISGEKSPAFYGDISEKIKTQVDYIVNYRQADLTKHKASSIIKIGLKNEIEIIRK